MRVASRVGWIVGAVVGVVFLATASRSDEPQDGAAADAGAARVRRLIDELASAHPLARRYAAYGLAQRNLDARPALPALFRALDDADPEVQRNVVDALGAIGEPAYDFLHAALEGSSEDRLRAARGLSHFGDEDTDTALAKHLEDGDARVRLAVARVLEERSEWKDGARLALALGLVAPSSVLQDEALDTIALATGRRERGPGFARAAPGSLIAMLVAAVRTGAIPPEEAGDAVMSFGPYRERIRLDPSLDPPESGSRLDADARVRRAVLALVRGLSARAPRTRQVAAELCAELGDDATLAAGALVRALADEGPADARCAAAVALARMGRSSAMGVPALVSALERGGDGTVAVAAAWALGELGERASGAVPALLCVLDRHATDEVPYHPDVCLAAARALGRVGPAAVSAVPTLVRVLGSHVPSADLSPEESEATVLDEAVEPAVEALSRIGAPAVPALLPLLTAQGVPAPVRRRVVRVLASRAPLTPCAEAIPALVAALGDADGGVRHAAICALAPLADEVASIPGLVQCLGSEDLKERDAAQEALWRRGARALPALEGALTAPSPLTRAAAARVLGLLDEQAFPAIPALVRALADEDSDVCAEVAVALEAAGARARFPLLALLVEGSNGARREAAYCLGRLGLDAAPAIPTLILALVDPDEEVVRAAALALARVGEPATAALLVAYREGGTALRAKAIEVFCARSAVTPASLAVLAMALGDPDDGIRSTAVEAMVVWRAAALPVLEAILAGEDSKGHVGALAVLSELAEDETLADPSRGLVIAHLGAFAGLARRDAIWLVAAGDWKRSGAEVERDVEAVVPAMVAALDDDLEETRTAASELLAQLGAVPALVEALDASSARARIAAATALGAIGPAAAPAVPHLVAWFADADKAVAECAAEVLGRIGRPAVEALIAALDADEPASVAGAVDALSLIGVPAASAIPRLERMIHEPDADRAARAIRPLMSVGGSSVVRAVAVDRAAVPDLRQAALAALRDEPAAPEITAAAVACLEDDEPYTVVMALSVLVHHEVRVDPAVLRRARHTEAEWVRHALEEALAIAGDEAGARALIARAGSRRDYWKYVGLSHLSVLREDLERLYAASHDREKRCGIVEALGEIADPRSVPFLARLLSDSDTGYTAGHALAALVMRRPELLGDAFRAHAQAVRVRGDHASFSYAWARHASLAAKHEAFRIGLVIAAENADDRPFLEHWLKDLEDVARTAELALPARTLEAWTAWLAQRPKSE